ncbi:hypothetical protein RFI_26086 [Reticulomyxa filosa]|uniref:Uncharacterized protein n=1 Tax=Reticulomyxa filosa TaxID=46433 RepID=X6MBP4_RETFI|nr:hypothetical protein RFI_26086 [Reticulomyxa filosa]|eukprot:ETO11294.1 hypothetical protein RFI_26086 [Reticulomyxa filosa]
MELSLNDSLRDKNNWKLYHLYTQRQYKACLSMVESQLQSSRGQCEYALYIKGLIMRILGNITESLQLFQAATAINAKSMNNLKQVARSLYLFGQYEASIAIFKKAEELTGGDWELWHNHGLCCEHLKRYKEAIECYQNANSIQKHDNTFIRMAKQLKKIPTAKVYWEQNMLDQSIETYKEALEFSPENPTLLTNLGLLYLRCGNYFDGFNFLGSSLSLHPTDNKTLLAAAAVIQNHQDMDAALTKYRICATTNPFCAELWSNIGMCFHSKNKYLESVATLKKALYFNPFDWCIAFNLG